MNMTPEQLREIVLEFDCFLNEPPSDEAYRTVRDYRHSAYHRWDKVARVFAEFQKLQDSRIAELAGEILAFRSLANNAITTLKSERDQLAAKLKALEEQEPVAIIGTGFQMLWCRQDWSKGIRVGTKRYASPAPAPTAAPTK